MRNRLEKSNMTWFDYTARKLGIFGIGLLACTSVFLGSTVHNLKQENNTYINQLVQKDDVVPSYKQHKFVENGVIEAKNEHMNVEFCLSL